jgi:3-isopropylmalate dehydrogenase
MVVVREICGEIYFGEPRCRDVTPDGQRRGTDTQIYTESEVSRIAHDAFLLA